MRVKPRQRFNSCLEIAFWKYERTLWQSGWLAADNLCSSLTANSNYWHIAARVGTGFQPTCYLSSDMWLSSTQWNVGRSDICHTKDWPIKASSWTLHTLPFPLSSGWAPLDYGSCLLKMVEFLGPWMTVWIKVTPTLSFSDCTICYNMRRGHLL